MFSFTWCLLFLWLQLCLQCGFGILVLSGGDWRWQLYARKVLVILIHPHAVPIWCYMDLEVSCFNSCLNMLITFASNKVLSFPGHPILFLFQLWSVSVWDLREHVRAPQAPGRDKKEMLMIKLWYGQGRDPQCHGMPEGRACPAVANLAFWGASNLVCMCYPAAVPPCKAGLVLARLTPEHRGWLFAACHCWDQVLETSCYVWECVSIPGYAR